MSYLKTPTVVRDRPSNANSVGTVTSGVTGLSLGGEFGLGPLRLTQLTLGSTFAPTATRNSTTSAYGSQALYTFPKGQICFLGAMAYVTVTRGETTNMTAGAAFYHSIGTSAVAAGSAATNTDTTTATLVNIIPATLLTLSGGTVTGTLSSIGAMTQLTDSSGGTASDTLAAISGTYTQSEVRNSIASLAAKINRIIAISNTRTITTVDGSSAAPVAYYNFSNSNSASAQIATGNSTLGIVGTVNLLWMNFGYTGS